ncbi:hypothetical protein [Streptomyces sp. NPDC127098]|uniref:hypothetical protein n=1 Tax=Streptomyces sp. NPDC127098 TaxID=3347137 RepID=UPI0036550775
MRLNRLATLFAAVAAAGTLVLSLPGTAQAATGTLTIGFQRIQDPSGCYNGQISPLTVRNGTDATATIYDQPDCQGQAIGQLTPGQAGAFEFGASVSIP